MNTMKKILALSVIGMIALVVVTMGVFGTQATKTASFPNIPGWSGITKFTHTWAATGADTILCPFTLANSLDSVVVITRSTSNNGDSVGLSVDFQQSMDNTNWKTSTDALLDTTVGINTHTDPKYSVLNVSFTRGYNLYPYNRLRIRALAINNKSTVLDAYVVQYKHGNRH